MTAAPPSSIINSRRLAKAGGSLRDEQPLAGHRSIEQTQAYIDASALGKRRLVALTGRIHPLSRNAGALAGISSSPRIGEPMAAGTRLTRHDR